MATTSDIKNGLCIKFNHDIYKIVEFLHVKPGKGPAFVRTKLKSLTNGKVLDNTFSAGHKIETVRVETHTFQYLYNEGVDFHFMNTETFEQITLHRDVLDAPDLLKEGTNVMVQINTETDMPLVDTMNARLFMAKASMDKEIAALYERRDKPKAAELYMDKAKNSWVDPNEIKPVEVPFYRAIFE
jgi:elongation factor P